MSNSKKNKPQVKKAATKPSNSGNIGSSGNIGQSGCIGSKGNTASSGNTGKTNKKPTSDVDWDNKNPNRMGR